MLEYTMIQYLGYLYEIYTWLIIIYVLMSWLPNVRESFVGEILGKIVEPYLSLFRRIIPPIGGMLDISPIIALFALRFVYMGLVAVVQYLF
ncbi:YggT family protein [Paenibacillus popilliae]|uniref:Predicted integral membrane protein n=1 Tax=Paenibacillus popilliae ATCC 14706 TaxID=1212764 RepID=M9LQ80_PAEPP|nr:YggT family protein [Paenibacillus popilliae]GAC42901.1 predicted integral membrane protein [Paenibacillus popilliae ATCC 14706]